MHLSLRVARKYVPSALKSFPLTSGRITAIFFKELEVTFRHLFSSLVLSPAYILESCGEFSNILMPGPNTEDSDTRSVVGFRPKELKGGQG